MLVGWSRMFVTSRHPSPNDWFIIVTCRLPVIQVAVLVILLVLLRILLDFSIPFFSSFETEPNQQLDHLCDDYFSSNTSKHIRVATTDQGSFNGPLNIKMVRILSVRFASLPLRSEKYTVNLAFKKFFTKEMGILAAGNVYRDVCCTKYVLRKNAARPFWCLELFGSDRKCQVKM